MEGQNDSLEGLREFLQCVAKESVDFGIACENGERS